MIKLPKSAVIVKFHSKRGAKRFALMMKSMIKNDDLPPALMRLIKKDVFETEVI